MSRIQGLGLSPLRIRLCHWDESYDFIPVFTFRDKVKDGRCSAVSGLIIWMTELLIDARPVSLAALTSLIQSLAMNTGLWLVERDHLTWNMASDWLSRITWPTYWLLIDQGLLFADTIPEYLGYCWRESYVFILGWWIWLDPMINNDNV